MGIYRLALFCRIRRLKLRQLLVGGIAMCSMVNLEASEHFVRRFLARAQSRAVLTYLAVGLLLIAVIVVEGREIEHHINAIEVWTP